MTAGKNIQGFEDLKKVIDEIHSKNLVKVDIVLQTQRGQVETSITGAIRD